MPGAAWSLSTGSGVDVAVVDTGINATQPDLVGQVLDFSGDTDDHDGHGTEVASRR